MTKKGLYLKLRSLIPKNWFGDMAFLLIGFVVQHRRFPRRDQFLFNDALFWILISSDMRNSTRQKITDKVTAKDYICRKVGPSYVVPSLALLANDREIEEYSFPDNCCIKSTHASGHVLIRKSGKPVDKSAFKSWLQQDHYSQTREANYRGIIPRIVVEPILFPGRDLLNYRVFCVHGIPKLLNIDGAIEDSSVNAFYLPSWEELDMIECKRDTQLKLKAPKNLSQMLGLASKLSAGLSFVRVDLYSNGEKILVGELTNCHGGAMRQFPHRADEALLSSVLFRGGG